MTTTAPAPSAELIDAVRAVDGVLVVTSAADAGVLRLELADGADEQAVGGLVDAVLRDRFGLATSSVDTVDELGPIPGEGRLGLERLVLTSRGTGAHAQVSLALDGRSAPGGAEGESAAHAVVAAVLLALEELTEDAVIGTVESVRDDADGVARIRLRLDVDGAEVVADGEAAVVRSRVQGVLRAVLVAIEPHLPG